MWPHKDIYYVSKNCVFSSLSGFQNRKRNSHFALFLEYSSAMHISYIICIFLIKYGNVDAKFKLPLIAEPKKYHLTIEPHLNPIGPSTFVGNVTIEFTALDNTNHLILHSRNLSISKKNIFIKHKKRSDISVLDISTNLEDEYIILHFNENLNVGEDYNLSVVNFHGNLSLDVNVGFYLGQYQDGSKNAK